MKSASTLVRATPIRRLESLAVVCVGGPIGCAGVLGHGSVPSSTIGLPVRMKELRDAFNPMAKLS